MSTLIPNNSPTANTNWPVWEQFFFRFFFAFSILQTSIWTLIPYLGSWLEKFSYHPSFFLQSKILGWKLPAGWEHPPTGSGDTLDDFLLLAANLILALLISLIWTFLKSKGENLNRLQFWLRVGLRYYLAFTLFSYGVSKLLLLQMQPPSMSQLATPLGELTPMRFTWLWIGHSAPYEFISGLLETVGGLLILFRRTRLLGLLLLIGVMGNVVMLNFFYGVPVKLYSSWLLIIILFLCLPYRKRLFQFFLTDKTVETPLPISFFNSPRQLKFGRWLKWGFILAAIGYHTITSLDYVKRVNNKSTTALTGAFDVETFKLRGAEINSPIDTNRWNRLVINPGYREGTGSGVVMAGTSKYIRAYHSIDSTEELSLRLLGEEVTIFTGTYSLESPDRIRCSGTLTSGDSLEFLLQRNERAYTLKERPFMWVMEQKDF